MTPLCPTPNCAAPFFIIRDGSYRRKDDGKTVQRYRCRCCGKRFSRATHTLAYQQKKRRVNTPLLSLLSSGVSQRRAARLLRLNKNTVARKLIYLGAWSRRKNQHALKKRRASIQAIQLDDLITKENSKLRPLSVTVAIDECSRRILAAEVSQIPAFGHLARMAVRKYGRREDQHAQGLARVFECLAILAKRQVVIKTDEHQRYPQFVRNYLPDAEHITFKSERACVAGQGELKKVQFDPLFGINHTCAMLRANVNRLIRKTWCTTKVSARLKDHLDIFTYYYNEKLLAQALTPL